jgi:hypothetical protein
LMKTTPELLALYTSQLTNITKILLASGAKHVQYALTTPFQADAIEDCGPFCSPGPTADASGLGWPQPINGGSGRCGPPRCAPGSLGCGVPNATAKALGPDPTAPGCGPPTNAVTKLNQAAHGIMTSLNVPILDLNTLVHSHCGADYAECALCDNETQYMGIQCVPSPRSPFRQSWSSSCFDVRTSCYSHARARARAPFADADTIILRWEYRFSLKLSPIRSQSFSKSELPDGWRTSLLLL